ncbi:hypothetical protein GCM10007920_24790 [Ciceribacter naphthalenivorans]|uniref:Uncharacterized protein n=2 Tax=Alphaproteobacteria TaxID=28211 RepID=A0A512HKZ7_9HYPH|nr:hypothetical protein RNA01_30560 [Ciceribacter naphthalenivorans]GLR22691.1 hypothetical protein GCM10007920_24790 [Ciceribacter naphthalenivorans]GLT05547.1 hypothetical protein GCM10007926_24790 [Sphingomonas psychrolutea]
MGARSDASALWRVDLLSDNTIRLTCINVWSALQLPYEEVKLNLLDNRGKRSEAGGDQSTGADQIEDDSAS